VTCAACAAELGPSLLACPRCHTLVHADRLKTLAKEAADARSAGDPSAELTAWRGALDLLPAESAQHRTIQTRVDELGAQLLGDGQGGATPAGGAAAGRPGMKTGAVSGLSGVLLLLLTKGKLLLLGLTKASTILSMLPAFALYWAAFGWRFAAGLIASIYIHEMGHVYVLRRFGIPASAPMFIPGLGAVIRSRLQTTHPRQEARVGLGGPIWGLAAAVAAFAIYGVTGAPIWSVIGRVGAWINLFNLSPVWQLDGARAFRALNRPERWLVTAAVVGTFAVTREGLLVLVGILAAGQALRAPEWPEGDRVIAAQFAGLVIVLSAMVWWSSGHML
jgi:Zn-dependent protease